MNMNILLLLETLAKTLLELNRSVLKNKYKYTSFEIGTKKIEKYNSIKQSHLC